MKSSLTKYSDFLDPAFQRVGRDTFKYPVIPVHRKYWEWISCYQCFDQLELLQPGKRGLVFGVGREPLPSLFARRGVDVVATDLPRTDPRAESWSATDQHAGSHHGLHDSRYVDRETFDQLVEFKVLDMADLPLGNSDFDFVWSICAMEHLGTLAAGLDFFKRSQTYLKLGGVAFHTTEFNCFSNDDTQDNNPSVLYRRRDLEGLGLDIDFSLGDHPYDQHVATDDSVPHLKVQVGPYVSTCVRLITEPNDYLH